MKELLIVELNNAPLIIAATTPKHTTSSSTTVMYVGSIHNQIERILIVDLNNASIAIVLQPHPSAQRVRLYHFFGPSSLPLGWVPKCKTCGTPAPTSF